MPIVPPQIPPSFFQLQESFAKEMNAVSGINEELMGSAIDDKAGILAALRQGAGLTTLQPLFDRLNLSQKQLGKIVMDAIQANYTPGKIKSILEGEEPAPLFYNKSFGRYHCAIAAGFDTETQKQMEFAQLVQLKELGFNIPPKTMIDSATLQNKNELIADMQSAEQAAQQAAQAQHETEVAEGQARINLANARAEADIGLGRERMSRISENYELGEERKAQAHKDDIEALLAFIKATKEIEGIDFAHLKEVISMQQMLQASTDANKEPAAPAAKTTL
jgi:Ni,Fe-hydrogenase maturation factor